MGSKAWCGWMDAGACVVRTQVCLKSVVWVDGCRCVCGTNAGVSQKRGVGGWMQVCVGRTQVCLKSVVWVDGCRCVWDERRCVSKAWCGWMDAGACGTNAGVSQKRGVGGWMQVRVGRTQVCLKSV